MDVRLPSSPSSPSIAFLQDTGATYSALPDFSGKLSPSLGSIVGGRWDTFSPHSYPLEGHPLKILLPALLSLTSLIHCRGHQRGSGLVAIGNNKADREACRTILRRSIVQGSLSRACYPSGSPWGGGGWLASTGKLPLLSTSLLPIALSRLRAAPHPSLPHLPGSNFPQPVLLPLLK